MKDPLDMFNALPAIGPVDRKDYPGNTVPKNRGYKVDVATSDELLSINDAPFKEYIVKGVSVKCYTVGAVARLLGRKVGTIRSWEYKGWLPKPKLRTRPPDGGNLPGTTPKGRRLYTYEQVAFLVEAHSRFHLGTPNTANWAGFVLHMREYPTT